MNGKSRSIIIPVVVLVVLSLALSVQAAQLTVKKTSSHAERVAAEAYWTRDRIADAPAMVMPVDMGPGGVDTAALDEVGPIGPEGSAAPGMADPDADWVAEFVYQEDWAALYGQQAREETLKMDVPADEPAGTRNVYTFFDVNVNTSFWRIYPHRWVGRLTFTVPGGSASCSATAISNNHIVTAAHCVYDTPSRNSFFSNWAFTPAYRNGNAPYGTFPGITARVLTAWVNLSGSYSINTWARHDVAIIGVGRNSAGQTLNQAVGWAGRLWNASNTQLNFNSGYPAQSYTGASISFPAQYLRACINESFTQTTETLGGGCFYGRGISGGPWLIGYKPFILSGQVNSVNSGLFIGQPNLYGARFNSSNIVPLCTADGC